MSVKKYLAELLGTFGLTFMVGMSIAVSGVFPLATPLVAALTLMLFVYTIGPISGCHINPAITVALLSLKKISMKDAAMYVVFQVLGAFLAMLAIQGFVGSAPVVGGADTMQVGLAEALGAAFFAFGICAVVHGKVDDDMSGVVIGGSLLFGIMAAMSFSHGILNPAVAVGIGGVSATYLLAPVAGAVVGMWVYRFISN